MKISYRVEKEDYVAAQKLHRSKGQTKMSRALAILGAAFYLCIFLICLIDMTADPTFWPRAVRPLLLIGVIWATYHWILAPVIWRRNYAKDRRFQEQFTAEISDDVIKTQSATFDSTVKWEYFLRVVESHKLFLLYVSPRLFHMIPKRGFAPGEADQFRELLKGKLPPK